MKLSQLAAKPQLIEVLLDDQETVDKYGEALSFWIYDRQDMQTFVKLATMEFKDFEKIAELVNKMILDETGQQVVKDDYVLPTDVMMKSIQKVVEVLGKPQTTTTPISQES